MNLKAFNHLSVVEQTERLLECCHCRRWAAEVAEKAPFGSTNELLSTADQCWATATEAEILEAFAGHPQIGDMEALRNRFATTATAEQGQVVQAGPFCDC